jgi:hypothetical protein
MELLKINSLGNTINFIIPGFRAFKARHVCSSKLGGEIFDSDLTEKKN